MKKIFTLFALLAAGLSLAAQPVLTQASVGAIGTTYYMGVADSFPGGIDEGSAGANITWDFTSLGVSDFDTVWFLSPAGTPFVGNFPTANLAIKQASLNGGYAYMESTASYLDIVGVAGDILGSGSPIVAPQVPPSRVAAFPTTYGNTFSGVTKFDVRIDASGFGIPFVDSARYKNIQDRDLVADAYGTIRIPDGTYSNTLRIKEVNHQIDSIWIHSGFTGWTLFQDSSYTDSTFTWWDETKGYFILQLDYIGGVVDQVTYQDPLVVASKEPIVKAFQIFPNPANQFVMITSNAAEGNMQVFDLTGKMLAEQKLNIGSNQLPTADFPEGQYLYRILDKRMKPIQSGKFAVQH